MFERKKIGLALSGGGAKGLAHIGVLQVLEEFKIPIDFISGTSIGAVIAAIYSAEPNAKKLEREVLSEDINHLIDYTLSTRGLIKGEKIEKYLEDRLKNLQFKDMKIPLFITAFDLKKNQEIIFNKGNVAKAVRASISIPGMFIPVQNKKRILVDGGVVDPIPTEVLKKFGAQLIIASNVNYINTKPVDYEEAVLKKDNNPAKIPSIIECTSKTMQVIGSRSSEADLVGDKADFIISVNLGNVGILDFEKKKKIINSGKIAARKILDDVMKTAETNPLKAFLLELNKSLNVEKIVKDVKKGLESNIKCKHK